MDRLNYNQLYYFYVVAMEGSIKAASEKLHLTQPTISGQLKNFEENLGYKLFERKYRKLELNKCGREILKKAEKIFVLGDELLSTLPNKDTKYRSEIRIGAVSSLANSLLHDFTFKLWKDNTVSSHLVHGQMKVLMKYLDEDRVDIILSDTPYGPSKKYKSINLGNQKMLAVGTERFKSARRKFPHSLTNLPYLAFNKDSQIQQEVDFFFKMSGIKPDIVGSADDATFIRIATENSLCFSILSEMSVRENLRSGDLIKIGEMSEIVSNCWAIVSNAGSKRVSIRKIINSYITLKKKK